MFFFPVRVWLCVPPFGLNAFISLLFSAQ